MIELRAVGEQAFSHNSAAMRQAARMKKEKEGRERKRTGKNTPVFECLREVSATRTISLLLPDPPRLHPNGDTQLAEKEDKKSRW